MTEENEPGREPGWYDDGEGVQRWWSGRGWTEHTQAALTSDQTTPAPLVKQSAATRSIATHPQADDADTIWSAMGRTLTGIGGGRFRLTAEMLYFEYGMLSTNSQQIQTWQIRDVDASQSITQKARGVGTITLRARRMGGDERVVLTDVVDFREGVRLINETAYAAGVRKRQAEQTQTVNYSGYSTTAGLPFPAPSATGSGADLMAELTKLAELKSQGILSDEEFAAAKRLLLKL